MEYAVMLFLSLICGYLAGKATNNAKILKLEKENLELNEWKSRYLNVVREAQRNANNAETRATTFARKIKTLEDIAIEGEQNNECAPVTLAKIKKELLITR